MGVSGVDFDAVTDDGVDEVGREGEERVGDVEGAGVVTGNRGDQLGNIAAQVHRLVDGARGKMVIWPGVRVSAMAGAPFPLTMYVSVVLATATRKFVARVWRCGGSMAQGPRLSIAMVRPIPRLLLSVSEGIFGLCRRRGR